VDTGVGHLIVDSFGEIARLDAVLDRSQDVLIRVTPGILPNTHSYVQTGGLDSKFGFGLEDGLAARAIAEVRSSRHLRLVGLHAHIGSQIFELEPYAAAIEALAELADGDWECRILNVGGGLGIAYTSADRPPSIDSYVEVKVRGVQRVFDPVPRILIEPGRSLVGNAGVTAYRHREGDSGGSDLSLGRRRDVRQPAPDALRLALRGDRRQPRGRGPGHPGDGCGHALRVGRHPDH
jgi:diaminopimelate decarboxylase